MRDSTVSFHSGVNVCDLKKKKPLTLVRDRKGGVW